MRTFEVDRPKTASARIERIWRKRHGFFPVFSSPRSSRAATDKQRSLIRAVSVQSDKSALRQYRPFLLVLSAIIALGAQAGAQVKPNANWRTLKTEHFYIHFTPELEEVARRAANDAEVAYAGLSRHLHPPRGKIDVVISDDVDFSNGYATPYPTNRIVVYANPPVFESALRFTDDPTQLVITHELTHIFHLDRVGGIWKVLQSAFGRSPYLFPNVYEPSWLIEGLAVYYESLLTGSGRIEGSEHRMIARTAALQGVLPRLDQLSLANPHFPYGYSVYAYGSLFMDYLGRVHGDSAMRTFVESSSRQLIPMYLNAPARRAFRRSFTSEYRIWAESLIKTSPPWSPPMPGWRDLTVDGAYAGFARWLNDSTLVYTGTPGRESNGAYKLTMSPTFPMSPTSDPARLQRAPGSPTSTVRERIGRRNSRSPNSVLADGSLLYSQLDYTSAYTIRSDLYIDRKSGGTRRLTHGARLAFPDARHDRLIVAVNTLPAGTRLAIVSADGRLVTPITSGGPDEQWSEPRWSPDGKHIAAVRWTRGGTSEIVVIDTVGRVEQTLIRERAVNASPSWSADGRYVYFSSDRSGVTNLYQAAFRSASPDTLTAANVQRVSDAVTGLFEPQPSPSGREIAATVFKADGYHIGVAPISEHPAPSTQHLTQVDPRDAPPISKTPAPSTKYSPWRSLLPRYWIPFTEAALDSNSARIGALTSGEDVVGRHSYQALLFVPTDNSGITGSLYYRDGRLGQPVIELVASQDWSNYVRILDATQQNRSIGMLRRRIRDASLAFTMRRPRARTSSYFSVGGGVEARDYAADSAPLLARIDSVFRGAYYYPRVVVSAGWGNSQYPALAISPEDGISLATTTRVRWRSGDTTVATISVVGAASAYKSLDLPGFAHHVIALHIAGGAQDNRGTGYYEVGGVNGGTLDVLPGYTLGEGRRTFGVRGFPTASLLGIRAFAGSVEYRAPLTLPGRGLGTLPLFLDRTSITLFGDAGTAWCPGIYVSRQTPNFALCTQSHFDNKLVFLEPYAIGSVGGELNVSAAVLSWDQPFRFRLGVAAAVLGTDVVPLQNVVSSYFTVGVSF